MGLVSEGVLMMSKIILNIKDENKAKHLLALLSDLDYVEAEEESGEKIWKGTLPVFDDPVYIPGFTMFPREELYER